MKNTLYIFAIFVLIAISSCQKVIDLKVTDTEPKFVIEAKYDAVKEEVYVKLSKTVNVFSNEDFPVITGADVKIINESGVATPLVDQADGTYLLQNYTPEYNSTYTMEVVADGITYEASDYLPTVVPLDSLSAEFQPKSTFFDEGYLVYINLTDPVGPNYYRVIRKVNGEYKRELGDQFMFDDEFSEGNFQKVPMFMEFYEVGDTVQIELISYSKKTFVYFRELRAIAGGAASSAAPANPTSAWSNDCLGHFSVFGYDTKSIVIKE